MTPSSEDAVPGSLCRITGCSAKIGSGELCPATLSGKLQLYGRCAVTGKIYPFPLVDVWIVPKLQFKIASVGIFEDANVGFVTNDTSFRERCYLHIRNIGIKIKVQKRKNIYILDAVPRSQTAKLSHLNRAAMPASADIRVIHPRRHYNIDLWFVFGGDNRPTSTPVVVSCKTTGGAGSDRKFSACGAVLVQHDHRLGDVIADGDSALNIVLGCPGTVPGYAHVRDDRDHRKFFGRLHNRFVTVISKNNRLPSKVTGNFGDRHPSSKLPPECNENLFFGSKTVT